MPRTPGPPLEKVTLNIYSGDRDTLRDFYPASGWSVAVREIIHKACERLRRRASETIQPAKVPHLELDDSDFINPSDPEFL